MTPLSFGSTTGAIEVRECTRCGLGVEHSELRYTSPEGHGSLWVAHAHTAPCGLPCALFPRQRELVALMNPLHLSKQCLACVRLLKPELYA